MDEKTWMDRRGYPHSVDAKVIERYTRTDYDHMSMTETVDDPVYYTQPSFILAKLDYRFVRNQDDKDGPIPFTNETLCIPSQAWSTRTSSALPPTSTAPLARRRNRSSFSPRLDSVPS